MNADKNNSNELKNKLKSSARMVYKSLLPAMFIASFCAVVSFYLFGYECSACTPRDLYYMMMTMVHMALFAHVSTLALAALYGFFRPERVKSFSFKLELHKI
jgi:hypothetical protein